MQQEAFVIEKSNISDVFELRFTEKSMQTALETRLTRSFTFQRLAAGSLVTSSLRFYAEPTASLM